VCMVNSVSIYGLGFGVHGLESGVQDLGFRVWGSGCRL